jgi:hypothetical protein
VIYLTGEENIRRLAFNFDHGIIGTCVGLKYVQGKENLLPYSRWTIKLAGKPLQEFAVWESRY